MPPAPAAATLSVTCADGIRAPLDEARLAAVIAEACEGLAVFSAAAVLATTTRHLNDGMAEAELAEAPVLAARTLVQTEPDDTRVAARLVLDTLRREALTFVAGHAETATQADMATR